MKHLAYSYRKKSGEEIPHYKYMIVVPEEERKKVNWRDGEELEFEANGDVLVLKPKSKKKQPRQQTKTT
jgi:AbrB family looped-hinge helix DNA binding protein